ncbi:hypothetical protein H8356DRAFT_641016 [Neocallimastix lanati (nom. inval.)]|nr:hypothetical protein H8356DRAFT_641016 [Neocallimastix sp. JGI-2020a]
MKSVTLPELPKDLSPEIKEQKYVKYEIEKPELHPVEKVGDRLMKYQKCSENGFEKYYEIESKNEIEECEEDSDYEEESPELLKLNPYNWKSQDHYAVLGLSKLRINATDEDIKNAYRKKVLRHHPDKKASDGNSNNDSFFKCIQKAYEIITDPVKRRQFDSVDPEFDESIPTKCSKEDFFEVLTPVFERNARFSNIQPVPSLGDMNSTREEVEEFYRFWSEFDSWRSFEYLDEEDVDSYDNREDKRYFERKNKNARAKHKKEDNQRIINLIDLAVRTDPRLALYRKADREAKEAKRLEKKAAQIAAANEEKKRKEEEEKAKERALKEEQEKIAREKKEKEMKKRIIRKEKKTLKKFLQENNYLIDPSTPASPEQIESQLKKLDGYIVQMDSDNLTAYRVYLLRAFENGWESASKYFDEDHLNEGEKYSAELAAMAPVEEVKEEVKEVKDSDVEPIVEEKKEEVEKVEVIEENKEPEVKPAVARMLKKLPSISRIGGMRRTRKKVIRKEYDSSSEDERELEKEKEKEKEEAAPETASKKKNKKKKKSKKKNSSEELKVNVEEEPTTEAVKEEVATPAEEPTTEKVKEEVVVPAEEPVVEELRKKLLHHLLKNQLLLKLRKKLLLQLLKNQSLLKKLRKFLLKPNLKLNQVRK